MLEKRIDHYKYGHSNICSHEVMKKKGRKEERWNAQSKIYIPSQRAKKDATETGFIPGKALLANLIIVDKEGRRLFLI